MRKHSKARTFVTVALLALGTAAVAKDAVIASRGDAEITFADVDARMHEIPQDKREGFINSAERIDAMLNQRLLLRQLAAEAEAAKLDQDPVFAARMKLARDRLLAEARLEQLAREPLKSDVRALAKEAWLTKPESFGGDTTVVVRHVLVKGDCACAPEPKAKAEQILARAKRGESFETLVLEASEDAGSRDKGGIIEVTPGARLDPAFAEAALQLKSPGDLSPVVKSAFGYHVLQLVERREAEKPPYEQVERDIVDFTERKERARLLKAHTDALNNEKLEADPEAIASLRSRYPGGVIPGVKKHD